ncbi:hypothetical protein MKX07_002713 [Trichoderma sp. CBMAI-0711]|nr:hypothetical protein MKX07_002713 [Trichoderma sp. CBMAI-0711]
MPPSNRRRRSFTCQPLARRLRTFVRSLSITMPSNKPNRPQSTYPDNTHASSPSTSSSLSSWVEVESNPESALSLETASISSIPSDTSSSSSSSSSGWTTDDDDDDDDDDDEPLETNPVDNYFTNALSQQDLTSQSQSLSTSPSSSSPSTPSPPPPSLSTAAQPYDTYTPLTTTTSLLQPPHQTPHEISRKRTQFFLRLRAFYQGLLPDDPFHEFLAISTSRFGAILPPDIYLTSGPPFPPTSTRGTIRLQFIRATLSMPLSAPLSQVEGFIGRNPSVVSHLCFNIQPFSNVVFKSQNHHGHQIYVSRRGALECNARLLRALKEIAWEDESADWVVGLARTEDARRLSALCKRKGKCILPSVRERMLRVEEKGERPVQDEQWHRQAVREMRRERPKSLLSNAILPHDVVEETK